MSKYITFLLAVIGLGFAVFVAATAKTAPDKHAGGLAAVPSINPFAAGIAATGAVEALSRNVLIAAPEGGVVTAVNAAVGQAVRAGDPLFTIDAQPLEAEKIEAAAAVAAAKARVERLAALPRAEEVPPVEAALAAARAEVADWMDQEKRLREAGGGAASERDVSRVAAGLSGGRAREAQAAAQLALMKAGAWGRDVDIARAELTQAEARVKSLQVLIDRRTVRSPIDGTVLKRNIEPGQFASTDPRSAAMVVGDLSRLNVRARIDEEDLPKLREGAAAVARVRGAAEIQVPLKMLRIEPLAEPKTQLSGSTTERVDTRVLEVIFEVGRGDKENPPMYPGQQVDVFIEAAGKQ